MRLRITALVVAATFGLVHALPASSAPSEARLRIESEVRHVTPGTPFEVTVVRSWPKALSPAVWSDAMLSPLVVEALAVDREVHEGWAQETRRFRARAFTLRDVRIPARSFRIEGQEARSAPSLPLRIRVRPTLPTDAPGPAEKPGPFLGRPTHRVPSGALIATCAALLLLLGGGLLWRARRRSSPGPAALEPTRAQDGSEAARLALDHIGALERASRDEVHARAHTIARLADAARHVLAKRLELDTRALTSAELLAATTLRARTSDAARGSLAALLRQADLAKFAHSAPTREELSSAFEHARAVIADGDEGAVS